MGLINKDDIVVSTNELDNLSISVDFDLQNDTGIYNTGGYVMISKEDDGFNIRCINGQGDVVNEYTMSYSEAYNGD